VSYQLELCFWLGAAMQKLNWSLCIAAIDRLYQLRRDPSVEIIQSLHQKEAAMTKQTQIDLAALGVIFSLGFLAIATALIA
jgi:hypothetical protein